MTHPQYDLVVIGSGPAGEKGAAQAAYFGKRVALIERESRLGGAAANTGTLPSKTLRETALYLSGFRQRSLYGVSLTLKDQVNARDFLRRERAVVQAEQTRIGDNLRKHKVHIINGAASFIEPNLIAVRDAEDETQIIGCNIALVATGSHPHRPSNIPFQDPRVYDSDTILNLGEIPKRMLVAGGGVIGCEYACMFAALGVEVTLVEGRDRLLGFMDAEVSETLAASLQNLGIRLLLNDSIETVECGASLEVSLKSGERVKVENLLAATGRTGNTASLRLENVGIHANNRGVLEVNEHYQTKVPNIYAAGDVVGFPALASTSMEQARVAMVHAFNLKYKEALPHILPYGIYTIPECSMAGETEESARQKGIPIVVGRARYLHNARGQIIGDDSGFLKLIFAESDMRLLGVHIIGELASELVHVGLNAMLMGAGADLFIQSCFNYPTLTELYKYATYDALGARRRKMEAQLRPEPEPVVAV